MNKVLAITGATGKKSGGEFMRHILENYDEVKKTFGGGVRVIVRNSSNTKELEKNVKELDIMRGDLSSMEFLVSALKDVDTIVHIAGIKLSRKLVDASVTCGVRRMILVHTTGIYSKYKEAGEEYRKIDDYVYKKCKANHILLTILRPTMIYGNISDNNVCEFIKMVDRFPIMPVVNGANYQLQPVHYKDLATAYYQVLLHEDATANKDFNLSGGSPIYLRDMLREIGLNLGKKVKFFSVPFSLAYVGAVGVWLLSLKKIDYREKVQRLCEPRIFSYENARKAFGYSPRDFEDGIVDEVKEYIRNKSKN